MAQETRIMQSFQVRGKQETTHNNWYVPPYEHWLAYRLELGQAPNDRTSFETVIVMCWGG